jgi:hypothetical protein
MQRVGIFWGMLVILVTPITLVAQPEHSSPRSGNSTAQPPAPVPPAPVLDTIFVTVDAPTRAANDDDADYWIGISCAVVDETLRSQLNLPAGSGLVIRRIADGSPAKVRGLAVHDVLTELRIGDDAYKLVDTDQLTKLLQQTHGKAITLLLLRGGKPLTVTVAPEERVIGPQPGISVVHQNGDLQLQTIRLAGPVLALERSPTNLRDDLTVVFTKSGSQPVEVVIRQKGRGEWKLKEHETANQPEFVSQAVISVMAYLSRLAGRVEVRNGEQLFSLEPVLSANNSKRATFTSFNPPAKIDRAVPALLSLQQRLDAIQKEQERVTKTLDELRKLLQDPQSQK